VLQKGGETFGNSEALKLMMCGLVRLVSFFQKIPGTKIILQSLGKKTQECPNAGVVTLQTSATVRSFFVHPK